MKKPILSLSFLLAIFFSSLAHSQSAQLEDIIYYDIGGASAFNRPLGYTTYDILNISAEASLSLSCGEFDLQENLEELMQQFSEVGDNIANLVEAFAANLISNLPMLILREVNPNLADLVEDVTARYEELYRIAIADCQEMQRSIREDDDPYSGWIRVMRRKKWKENIDEGQTATRATETVDEGANIVWIGGTAAGKDSDIRIVNDLTTFGYTTLSSASAGGIVNITTIFPDAAAASAYATQVLGETTINQEAGMSTAPGAGVLPQVETEYSEILETIDELVTKENATAEELTAASSSYVRLTGGLMDALRNEREGARNVYVRRLASEIATAKQAEKLLALRRIFLTARREPHVLNTPAWGHVNEVILPELNQELDYLLQQEKIAKAMVSDTSKVLLNNAIKRRNTSENFLGSPNTGETIEGFPVE